MLTFNIGIAVPQEHLSMGLLEEVWKGTGPLHPGHRKFSTSSVMSCICGQSSWQGMPWHSNQYCFVNLSYKIHDRDSGYRTMVLIYTCLSALGELKKIGP